MISSYGYGSYNYFEYYRTDVTILNKDGSQIGNNTYSFNAEGVRNNPADISINGQTLNLTVEDYIYFRCSINNTYYYASIKISDLNSGEGQSLTFSTTNPL